MSFNFLPKNAITGRTSDGKKFEAFEYDFTTYAVLQMGGLLSLLVVGGLFSAISGLIILIMLMSEFTGRFNLMSLSVPILSGYWLYDCHNGWIFSAIVDFFVGKGPLLFLAKMNVGCIAVITIMTLLSRTIYNTIIRMTNDANTRYIIFFVAMFVVFMIAYVIAGDTINEDWLGVSHIYKNVR
jgi:hypothetical protein